MAIDSRWKVSLQGREYVLFPGLLHLAHENGLRSIETELVQIPGPDNRDVAIIRAIGRFASGDGDAIWSAYGDASPANTRGPIQTALIRMAETRAIGRMLRMACDVGETMLEELGDTDDEAAPNGRPRPHSGYVQPASPAPGAGLRDEKPAAVGQRTCQTEGCRAELTPQQIAVSQRHYGLNLCPRCQTAESKRRSAARTELVSATPDEGLLVSRVLEEQPA